MAKLYYWTDERREFVLKKMEAGWSASEIAAALPADPIKPTRNSIIGIWHRAGRSRPMRGARPSLFTARRPREAQRSKLKQDKAKAKPIRKPSLADLGVWDEAIPVNDNEPIPATVVALVDLEPHHCRWVHGDPKKDRNHGFCGQQIVPGLSYCKAHAQRVFQPPEMQVRAKLRKAREMETA